MESFVETLKTSWMEHLRSASSTDIAGWVAVAIPSIIIAYIIISGTVRKLAMGRKA